jgi:hypothetical protein
MPLGAKESGQREGGIPVVVRDENPQMAARGVAIA